MLHHPYRQVKFLTSAAKVNQLPEDTGFEVAFAGRSNAGKSSALNTLTEQKQLARTSKTPGRTQLINLFSIDDERRLVDLPGYGYAKVPLAMKLNWQKELANYLEVRQCLKGLVLLMDVRHPLKDTDSLMIQWAHNRHLPVHVLLTKADKLSRGQAASSLQTVKNALKDFPNASVQLFSSLNKQGLEALINIINRWYAFDPAPSA